MLAETGHGSRKAVPVLTWAPASIWTKWSDRGGSWRCERDPIHLAKMARCRGSGVVHGAAEQQATDPGGGNATGIGQVIMP